MHQYRHEADEYRRIELITGVARRRRWSAAEKAAVVAESLQPGINVSMVARRHGVSRGLLPGHPRQRVRTASGPKSTMGALVHMDTRPLTTP